MLGISHVFNSKLEQSSTFQTDFLACNNSFLKVLVKCNWNASAEEIGDKRVASSRLTAG